MKTGIVAGFVALVFVAGILVGASVLGDHPKPPAAQLPQSTPAPAIAPRVELAPTAPAAPVAAPAGPRGPRAPVGPQAPAANPSAPGPDPGVAVVDGGPPPPAPPPPAPAALAESERLRAAHLSADGRGNGQVVDLSQGAPSDPVREQWEKDRRAGWEARLTREREIKVRTLKERCQLTAAQESQLVAILEAESAERTHLVDALSAGTISSVGFDEGVKRNVEQARGELRQLLTAEQLAVYDALAPREQVLREETH